jgi:mono/diheme cytochrome c family protein
MRSIALVLTVMVTACASGATQRSAAAPAFAPGGAGPTFTETIAPLVYNNCVSCHRPGAAAPFSLITYEDVAKRGELIAKVTKSRYMPPWKAVHGYGEFKDERRLTDAQIASIGEWVTAGMPAGDRAKMPALPTFTDGWQLGKPDLVLEMPAAYAVPASGPDIYRNFVIPTGLAEDRWIRAVEFRPSARKAVHHAIFTFVRGGAVKHLDGRSGQPGFGGAMPLVFVPAFQPAGELGGWAVGMTPRFFPEGVAKRINKESDLVVQMHFHPTGKPETERSTIGIYFAESAPARRVITPGIPGFFGALAGIDIPPGEKAFTIKGSLVAPRDLHVMSVMPHAHYLGKEFKVTATLPDASTKPLLWIQDWDFNWQDRYDYKEPVFLPKGTRIDLTITYDNSPENPRNPCNPPRRVRWGVESFDEMGSVNLLMLSANNEDEARPIITGEALKEAIGKVRDSDAVKDALNRFREAQKRLTGDPALSSADPCTAR